MSDIEKLMDALMEVELNEKKKLDPVGQEDDDVDNDGDTDSSDEYLKNRRKKVGQAMKKEEGYGKTKKESTAAYGASQQKIADKKKKDAISSSDKAKLGKLADLMKKEGKMECPKCKGDGCSHCDDKGYHMKEDIQRPSMEELVSSVSQRTVARWTDFSEAYDEFNFKGKKRPQDRPLGKSDEKPPSPGANQPKDMGGKGNSEFEKHTYGATPPEGMFDKESEKSKAFIKMHQQSDPEWENKEDEGHDDVVKAGRGVKSQSPNRMGRDNRKGDNNIINPIKQKV
jgi:hypothetical protein